MSVAGGRSRRRSRRRLLGSLLSASLALADLGAFAASTSAPESAHGLLNATTSSPIASLATRLNSAAPISTATMQQQYSSSNHVDYHHSASTNNNNPTSNSRFHTSPQSLQAFQDEREQEFQAADDDQQQLAYVQRLTNNPIITNQLVAQENTISSRVDQQQQTFGDWWHDFWSSKPFPSGYTQSSITLLACFIGTIIILIVIGNLLVCIAIFTEKSLKPTQNWFIASLAVSDMLLGLVVMPFSLARELMGFWMFGPMWCDIHEAMDVLLTTASINTLCLISLDRYWSITQAVNYLKKRTPRRGAFMIAFVWFFSAAVSLPPLFGWKKQTASIIIEKPNQTKALSAANKTQTYPKSNSNLSKRSTMQQHNQMSRFNQQQAYSQQPDQHHQLSTPMLTIAQVNRLSRRQATGSSNNFDNLINNSGDPADYSDSNPISELDSNYNNELAAATTTTQATPALTSEQSDITEYPSCQLSDDVGYVVYSALGSFYLPCAVMVFTYIKIFLAARSRARRTIVGKPSRKELRERRHMTAAAAASARPPSGSGNGPAQASGRLLVDSTACLPQIKSPQDLNPAAPCQPVRGKIVIVERKKSLAASSLAPLSPQDDDQSNNPLLIKEATTSCTLTTSKAVPASAGALDGSTNEPPDDATNEQQSTLDQDQQHLKQSDSASSIVTVMKPSMTQVPVTRFNFQANNVELFASQTARAEEDRRSASALLDAITSMSRDPCKLTAGVDPQIGEILQQTDAKSSAQVEQATNNKDKLAPSALNNATSQQSLGPSTKETCFMTMDEDSEMIDEQAGRTIFMVASNSSHQPMNNHNAINGPASLTMTMTMLPPANNNTTTATTNSTVAVVAGGQCTNVACRRRAAIMSGNRSGSSYCGSDTSMNEDEVDEVDQCHQRHGHHHNHHNHHHHLHHEDEEDEEEDEDDGLDDEDALMSEDGCNGFSVSCGEADSCSRCHECDADSNNSYTNCNARNVSSSFSDSPCTRRPRHHMHNAITGPKHKNAPASANVDSVDLEAFKQHKSRCSNAQDQLECRQGQGEEDDEDDDEEEDEEEEDEDEEEESSSVLGHDLLDATAGPMRSNVDKRKSIPSLNQQHQQFHQQQRQFTNSVSPTNQNTQQQQSASANRKRSIIGIRLPSLGGTQKAFHQQHDQVNVIQDAASKQDNIVKSSTPNKGFSFDSTHTNQSGDKSLATTGQPQQQPQQLQQATNLTIIATAASSNSAIGGTRNLKALRQNFFLKLNQLTAKSTNKHSDSHQKTHKLLSASSSDKPSLSYEPSTSNAMDYPMETTIVDEFEQNTSGENQNSGNTIDMEPTSCQQAANSSNQTIDDDNNKAKGSGGEAALKQPQGLNRNSSSGFGSGQYQQANKRIGASGTTKSMIVTSSSAEKSGLTYDEHSGSFQTQPHQHHHQFGNNAKKNVKIEGSQISSRSGTFANSANNNNTGPPKRTHLPSDTERHKRKLAKARERRATLILGLIMAAFITSWMPFFTFYVLRALCTVCRDYIPPRLEAFIFWMGYCNSAINPIIYTIFNRDFRKAFRKILFRCL